MHEPHAWERMMDKNIDFNKKYDDCLTIGNVLTMKAIETIIETGEYSKQSYSTLAILGDGAGISFGPNQATAKSEGLCNILRDYVKREDAVKKYVNKLLSYDTISNYSIKCIDNDFDKDFQDLIIEIAQEDRALREVQRKHMHEDHFRKAYEFASEEKLALPLSYMVMFDFMNQSSVKFVKDQVLDFDEIFGDDLNLEVMSDEEFEKEWIMGLIDYRHNYLTHFIRTSSPSHTEEVRKSSYRTESLRDLARRDLWDLEIPMDFHLTFTYKRTSPKIKTFKLNEEVIRDVGLY